MIQILNTMNLLTRYGFFMLLSIMLQPALFSPALANDYDDTEADEDDLPFVAIDAVTDFEKLSQLARRDGKVIMLEVTASYCDYCHLLEEEIIKPMLRSGDYEQTVFIRQLEIDGLYPVNDFSGQSTSHARVAERYKVILTPTLLFLDADGKEVAPRILGINSLDFFGAYVDEALEAGLSRIRQRDTDE